MDCVVQGSQSVGHNWVTFTFFLSSIGIPSCLVYCVYTHTLLNGINCLKVAQWKATENVHTMYSLALLLNTGSLPVWIGGLLLVHETFTKLICGHKEALRGCQESHPSLWQLLPPCRGSPLHLSPYWGSPLCLSPCWGSPPHLSPCRSSPLHLSPCWGSPLHLSPCWGSPPTFISMPKFTPASVLIVRFTPASVSGPQISFSYPIHCAFFLWTSQTQSERTACFSLFLPTLASSFPPYISMLSWMSDSFPSPSTGAPLLSRITLLGAMAEMSRLLS